MSIACHCGPLLAKCERTNETAFVGIFACMCTVVTHPRCTRGYCKTASTQHLPVSISHRNLKSYDLSKADTMPMLDKDKFKGTSPFSYITTGKAY